MSNRWSWTHSFRSGSVVNKLSACLNKCLQKQHRRVFWVWLLCKQMRSLCLIEKFFNLTEVEELEYILWIYYFNYIGGVYNAYSQVFCYKKTTSTRPEQQRHKRLRISKQASNHLTEMFQCDDETRDCLRNEWNSIFGRVATCASSLCHSRLVSCRLKLKGEVKLTEASGFVLFRWITARFLLFQQHRTNKWASWLSV